MSTASPRRSRPNIAPAHVAEPKIAAPDEPYIGSEAAPTSFESPRGELFVVMEIDANGIEQFVKFIPAEEGESDASESARSYIESYGNSRMRAYEVSAVNVSNNFVAAIAKGGAV